MSNSSLPDGLKLIRNAVSPEIAHEFYEELYEEYFKGRVHVRRMNKAQFPVVIEKGIPSGAITIIAKSTGANVLKTLGLDNAVYDIFLNYQQPGAVQDFHFDSEEVHGDITVIHLNSGGAFDYSLTAKSEEQVGNDFESISVNAGDLIIQTGVKYLHRGRNPSPEPRITTVVAQVREY